MFSRWFRAQPEDEPDVYEHRIRHRTVRAVQFTGHNMFEIAEFAGESRVVKFEAGKILILRGKLGPHGVQASLTLYPRQWVMQTEQGRWYGLSDSLFRHAILGLPDEQK